jgi:LysR family transcriptional regulator, chromosome initiation inhibitor
MIIFNQGTKAFLATVELGTVHAAAEKMGLTQTAVTQRIKALEADLGLTLFLRSRRGMALTEDGSALLQYCRAAGDLEGVFLSRVSGAAKGDVSLTLVGPTSALSTRIADNCQPLYKKYPYLRLHLRADDHSNRTDLVRRGIADLAIVPPEDVPNEMESKRLKPDRYLLVASSDWKGRRIQDILENERIIDFYENDETTRKYLKHFDLLASVKKERLFVNENEALIRLFSSGVGYGTLTESVARPHLEKGNLLTLNRGQAMEDALALIWYSRSQKPDYFTDLIQSIK